MRPRNCSWRRRSQQVTCKYHPGAPLIANYHSGDMLCSTCRVVVMERCPLEDEHSGGEMVYFEKPVYVKMREDAINNNLSVGVELPEKVSIEEIPRNATKCVQIRKLCRKLKAGKKVAKRATAIYSMVLSQAKGGVDRRSTEIASVYYAIKEEQRQVLFSDICEMTGIQKKDLKEGLRLISRNM